MTADGGRAGRRLLVGLGVGTILLLLVAALLLTAARLWQPSSGPWQEPAVRLAALVPVAIPVYLLAGVGAVVVLVRRWRLGVPLIVWAVAGVGLHLWWFSPYLTHDAPAAADGPHLRVLTLNALAYVGASGEQLLRVAHDAHADVVVVEELTGRGYQQALRAGLPAAFPHRSPPLDAGDVETMIWSRLPLTDVHKLREVPLTLHATLRWEGRDLDFLGVHTAPPIWPAAWSDDHAALLHDVRARRPDLMAGDFNATPDHVQLRRLLDEGLTDAADLAGTGWSPTWPSNGRQQVLGIPVPRFAAIDHVLVGEGWTVVSLQRVEIPRSDHTGVLAELAPAR